MRLALGAWKAQGGWLPQVLEEQTGPMSLLLPPGPPTAPRGRVERGAAAEGGVPVGVSAPTRPSHCWEHREPASSPNRELAPLPQQSSPAHKGSQEGPASTGSFLRTVIVPSLPAN